MTEQLTCRCCIAGGGPAGIMLGLLLARAGVDVIVLEKHADFLRDFRGDTVHPSTLQVLEELGMLDRFLMRPHDEVRELQAVVGGTTVPIADFSRLHHPFIALMPQWEFLDFLAGEARRHSSFRLRMNAEVLAPRMDGAGRVTGVRGDAFEVHADLVIAADGRHSVLRDAAGLPVRSLGAPIDVLWMRIPKGAGDPPTTGGRIERGRFLAMLDRGSYWQCAYVIPKGGMASVRRRGLEALRADLAQVAPMFAGRLEAALPDWDAVKLLSVSVDRLDRWWREGLLAIGDAAHAMSPIGGVGINLAIQDAVAAANILAPALADLSVDAQALTPLLARVQRRRLFPVRVIQALQVLLQDRLLSPLLAAGGDAGRPLPLPWPLKLLSHSRLLRSVPAFVVGIGVRPEHVRK